MRDAKKRVKELAEALKREPTSIPKRLELAAALREVGRPVEAIDFYRQVASAYAAEGRLVQAIAVCKGILEIDPQHRDTLEMLADLASRNRPPPAPEPSRDEETRDARAAQTPADDVPFWGSALYSEEEEGLITPANEPAANETVVGRKGSGPRSGDELRDEADAVIPFEGGEPIATSHWSDTDKTPAPVLLPQDVDSAPASIEKKALDFPPEVKRLARGDKLLAFAAEPEMLPPPPVTFESLLTDEEKDSTRAGTPRALESGREPAADPFAEDQETLTWDDDDENKVLADALAAPLPKPDLQHEPPPFPLLSDLPRQAFLDLLARMSVVRLAAGEMVLREGEAGDACYLIVSGQVRVLKSGIDVAHLGAGTFFGEFAVLADQRRHASVETMEPTELLEIRRALLDELVTAHPGVARTLRTYYRERLMSTLLQTAPFFAGLSNDERRTIVERFRPRRFARGSNIIDEGAAGGGLYLILVGEVMVVRGHKEEVVLGKLGEGSYFGEMSLLKGGVAFATVRASRMTEVVQLPPRDFYEVVSQHPVLWEQLRSEAERRELANSALLTGELRESKDGSYLL
jgi:CRP-like cAMP-binding protein